MNRSDHRFRCIVLVFTLVALPLGFAGCATNQPVGQQIDDSAITASVKTQFAADSTVSALNIDIDTLDGVVTLSGIVNSASEKSEAARIAAATEHVRRVVNNLKVKNG